MFQGFELILVLIRIGNAEDGKPTLATDAATRIEYLGDVMPLMLQVIEPVNVHVVFLVDVDTEKVRVGHEVFRLTCRGKCA